MIYFPKKISEKMNLQIPQNRKVQIKIVNLKSTFFNRKTRKTKLIKKDKGRF